MKIQVKNWKTNEVIAEGKDLKVIVMENRADLRGANLRGADLWGADLRGANLRGADLREADLREANLWEANLWEADLRGADLRGANLRGADLDSTYIHIKGSRFDLYCIGNQIQIGCEIHTIEEWEEKGIEIAKENRFTDDEIKEHKKYIEICKELNKGE